MAAATGDVPVSGPQTPPTQFGLVNDELVELYKRAPFRLTTYGGTSDAITADGVPFNINLINAGTNALLDGQLVILDVQAANTTTTPTLAIDAVAAKTIVRADGSELFIGENQPNYVLILRYNLSSDHLRIIMRSTTSARDALIANRTYYVATTGSDSNDGLTVGNPFATVLKAIQTTQSLDLGIYDVDIQMANGTYTTGIICSGPFLASGGVVTLKGDTTTPSNVTISTTSASALDIRDGCSLRFEGMKFTVATSQHAIRIRAMSHGTITGTCDFGVTAFAHIKIENGRFDNAAINYTISGNARAHYEITEGGTASVFSGTVTVTGTPNFTTAFARVETGSALVDISRTFSGSATGSEYSIISNGIINTNGAGAGYFPGNSGGSTATGGQYV